MKKRAGQWHGSQTAVILTLLSSVVLVPLTVLAGYEMAFADLIYPGLQVRNIPIGGKSIAEAAEILNRNLVASQAAVLTFGFKDQKKSVVLADLGFRYDASASASYAWTIGRSPDFWNNLKTRFNLIRQPINLNPNYALDPMAKKKLFLELHALVDQPPIPAQLALEENRVLITQAVGGQILDEVALEKILHEKLTYYSLDPIILPVDSVDPTLDQDRAEKGKQILNALLKQPLELVTVGQKFVLTAHDVLSFIQPIGATTSARLNEPDTQIFAPVPKVSAPSQEVVNTQKILTFLKNHVALFVDRPPRDAVFRIENGRAAVFVSSQEGYKLDTAAASNLITSRLEQLAGPESGFTPTKIDPLELKVTVIQPKIPNSAVNNLGIETLLGRGVSYFKGSIANRIDNIELASSHFNGVLIEPDTEASFNQILGEVTAQTGYKSAYVIKQGRTVLDDGGGVCQVSTTLFRAVLNAGLPIPERTAHAYRVAYYEQGFDPGLDATVYAPSVDLKFKNDTPAYLLIQTQIDRKNSTLTFEVYGADDGRKALITKPQVSNVQPPPPPLHQDDPDLPKGTTKQIDWAAWGAKVVFNYKVTRGGETIFKQTYVSNYRPWQAVYLVGTKEE